MTRSGMRCWPAIRRKRPRGIWCSWRSTGADRTIPRSSSGGTSRRMRGSEKGEGRRENGVIPFSLLPSPFSLLTSYFSRPFRRRSRPASRLGDPHLPLPLALRLVAQRHLLLLPQHLEFRRLALAVRPENPAGLLFRFGGTAIDRDDHIAGLERVARIGGRLEDQHPLLRPEVLTQVGVQVRQLEPTLKPAIGED